MILFFRTPSKSVIAVESNHPLAPDDSDKLCWLFGEAKAESEENLKGCFVGPRREMITPWSTNAVEITQNMGLEGISRIEEYFPVKDENADYDPMLQRMYKGLDQNVFTTNRQPEPIVSIEDLEAYNEKEGLALSKEEMDYLKKVEKALTPKAAKQVIELADQNKDFTVDDIDKTLNPPKIKKVYKSSVYNTIYSVEPLLIQGMTEQELDELVYKLLKQHMTEQQEGGNEVAKPVRWDGKSMQAEVDTAVIRISRKYDIRRMLERNVSAFDIATQLRNHCINMSYGTPDGEYTIFCGDTMLIKFTNRILNANGATRLELTWRQVADELIKLTELSMDNLKSE